MVTIEDIEKRVVALEERVGGHDADMGDIPRLVTMHFDLLRAEMRAMERRLETKIDRIETRFETKIDAAVRSIAELIVESGNKS